MESYITLTPEQAVEYVDKAFARSNEIIDMLREEAIEKSMESHNRFLRRKPRDRKQAIEHLKKTKSKHWLSDTLWDEPERFCGDTYIELRDLGVAARVALVHGGEDAKVHISADLAGRIANIAKWHENKKKEKNAQQDQAN